MRKILELFMVFAAFFFLESCFASEIPLTKKRISEILKFHNDLKREVGNGLKHANIFSHNRKFLNVNYKGDSASNNYRYEWHPILAAKAAQLLSKCSSSWACKKKMNDCTVAIWEGFKEGKMGYNMHAFMQNYRSTQINPRHALESWLGQEKLDVEPRPKFNEMAELAQMLHSPASYIGCAMHKCEAVKNTKARTLFLCIYDEQIKSLSKRSQLFESGKPCKEDSECTTHANSACDFVTGMCVRLPTEKSVVLEVSEKLSKKLTSYMTLLFNSLRSRVAKGIAKDDKGRVLPAAANMYKLTHRLPLNKNHSVRIGRWCLPYSYVTQQHTHQYVYQHQPDDLYHELTKKRIEEPELKEPELKRQRLFAKLFLKAFKKWEKILLATELQATQLRFTKSTHPHTHEVPASAQMIVGSHTKLACSIHHCELPDYILVVCVLDQSHANIKQPPHNYLPYQVSRPCMLDDDCNYYHNSKCDRLTGLCEDPVMVGLGENLTSRYWPSDKPENKRMEQMALYLLNDYREKLAEGHIMHSKQLERGARVMFLLSWSESLAKEAINAISGCHVESPSTVYKRDLSIKEDDAMFIQQAVDHWVELFTTDCILCTVDSCVRKRTCEIFNALDTEVGCAVNWCQHREQQWAHCKFRSVQKLLIADLKHHYPYPEGPTCSTSEDNICAKTYANSVCIRSMGLCVARGLGLMTDVAIKAKGIAVPTLEALNRDMGSLINMRRDYLTHMQHFYKHTTEINQGVLSLVNNSILQREAQALSQSCWKQKPFEEYEHYRYTLYNEPTNDNIEEFYKEAVQMWWNKNRLTKNDNQFSWRYYKTVNGQEYATLASPEMLQYGCGISVCESDTESHSGDTNLHSGDTKFSLVCVFSDGAPKPNNKKLGAIRHNDNGKGLTFGETKISPEDHIAILTQINQIRREDEKLKLADIQTSSSVNSNYRQARDMTSSCMLVDKPSSQNFIAVVFEREYESYPAQSITTTTFIKDAFDEWRKKEHIHKMRKPSSQHASCAINYCDFKHLLVCVLDS